MIADSALVAMLSPSPNRNDRRGKAIDMLLLHYTGMSSGAAARARLLDPASEVSCHYLVWEDGRIEQMVAEADRAWHAGRSFWAGERDVNAISIGIEIVNAGHEGGAPAYPAEQIAAVTALAQDICTRRAIRPERVLGHSDVAPGRKEDPGEWFPWKLLAKAGVGLAPVSFACDPTGGEPFDLARFQEQLSAFGYDCPLTGAMDPATQNAVRAFQRHYLPWQLGEPANGATHAALRALVGRTAGAE